MGNHALIQTHAALPTAHIIVMVLAVPQVQHHFLRDMAAPAILPPIPAGKQAQAPYSVRVHVLQLPPQFRVIMGNLAQSPMPAAARLEPMTVQEPAAPQSRLLFLQTTVKLALRLTHAANQIQEQFNVRAHVLQQRLRILPATAMPALLLQTSAGRQTQGRSSATACVPQRLRQIPIALLPTQFLPLFLFPAPRLLGKAPTPRQPLAVLTLQDAKARETGGGSQENHISPAVPRLL